VTPFLISTTGLTNVEIKAYRSHPNGLGFYDENVYSWAVNKVVVHPSQTNVTCYGGSDGSATASPTGGSNPYSYSWNTTPTQTTATATGLQMETILLQLPITSVAKNR